MIRKIVNIDEEKCNGCGLCVPNCAEGALQIIDKKARLISDLFCDGLGACIGNCPEDAIMIEEREAEPYDEMKVMNYIVKGGRNVIKAHMKHLKEHNEFAYLAQAKEYLLANSIDIPLSLNDELNPTFSGCPGSKERIIAVPKSNSIVNDETHRESELRQWPVQLHLVSPNAQYFRNADLLLTADCVGFAYPDFHKDFLKNKSLAIACPKLDSNKQVYLEKLISMINNSELNSITVLIMEVPCCGGLLSLAKQAIEFSERKIPLSYKVINIEGNVINN